MTLRIHPTFAPVVLHITKGDAFDEVLELVRTDGTPTDLTGTEWTLSVRAALTDEELFSVTPTLSGTPTDGTLTLTIGSGQTEELDPKRHWFFYLREETNEHIVADGPVRVWEPGRTPATPFRHRSMQIH